MDEKKINGLSEDIIKKCKDKNHIIATAESCTGGMVASSLTSIPGSSEVFDRGFITYSNLSKSELLGIDYDIINEHGAVSSETAIAMALGAVNNSQARISVSITGVAGPSGGTDINPVGKVYIATANEDIINLLFIQQIGYGYFKSAEVTPFDYIHSYLDGGLKKWKK